MAGLTMVAESWLNHRSTNATRGRVLSVYIIVMNAAFATGPLLLNLGDASGSGLLVVAGILFVAALLPVALTRTGNPEIGEQARLGIGSLFKLSPLGVLGVLVIGLVESAVFGLGAVYGNAIGLDASDISIFLAVTVGGVLVMQYPLGALSDRYDREKIILAVAATAAVAAALIALLGSPDYWLLLVLGFVVGGLASPLYPLSVAETNDWLEENELVPAGAGMVLAYSIGASIGPRRRPWSWTGSATRACSPSPPALWPCWRFSHSIGWLRVCRNRSRNRPISGPPPGSPRWLPKWTRAARTSPTTTRAPKSTGTTKRRRKTRGSAAYAAAFSSSLRRAMKALSSSSMAGSWGGCS
jgi:MFS family permease